MRQITDRIYLIEGPRFQFPYCNCLVVKDDRTCLMDSAITPEDLREVKNRFHVDLILDSHGHVDHVYQNVQFKEPVYFHPAEDVWVQSAETFMAAFGFTKYGEEEFGRFFMEAGGWQPRLPDAHFMPGEVIDLGRTKVEVIHLPGHTPGHCGFFIADEGILFAADIDLTSFGPFYGNAVSNVNDFITSLDRLIEMQPDMIVTGHGEGVVKRNIRQRLRDFRDIIFRREEELLATLRQLGKVTLRELASRKVIYRRRNSFDHERLFIMMEMCMDEQHLDRLVRDGKVVKDGEYYAALS